MNGQMKKYKESLKNMGKPIMLKDVKQRVNIKGIMEYAKKKGVKVAELSDEEKSKFMITLS